MDLALSEPLTEELRDTLGEVISDMSREIAGTDNPAAPFTVEGTGGVSRYRVTDWPENSFATPASPGGRDESCLLFMNKSTEQKTFHRAGHLLKKVL